MRLHVSLKKKLVHDGHIHWVIFPHCVEAQVALRVYANINGFALLAVGFGEVYTPAALHPQSLSLVMSKVKCMNEITV